MRLRRIGPIAMLWVGLAQPGHALPALRLDTSKVSLEFSAASTNGAVKIRGVLKEGTPGDGALIQMGRELTGSIRVPLNALDTGIALRTRHMKEKYLETAKFPVAELNLGSLPFPDAAGDFRMDGLPFKARLKLHGVDKPISGKATLWRKGKQLGFVPEFRLTLKDFAIDTPSFLGVRLTETVDVKGSATGDLEEIIL